MPRRVEEYSPTIGGGLKIGLDRPAFDCSALGDIQIVDEQIEMHLLGHLIAGPVRRPVVFHPLDRQHHPRTSQYDYLIGFVPDLEIQQGSVELAEVLRIAAIE